MMVSGTTATTLNVDGNDIDVKVEYADDEYDTIDKLQGIVLPTATGGSVALMDIADIGFKDSPQSITKSDKQYQVTITGTLTEGADSTTKDKIQKEVIDKYLSGTISMQENTSTKMMNEEFASLGQAIATAVFLVFVVMAAQFESPKFSIMVMTTIPVRPDRFLPVLMVSGLPDQHDLPVRLLNVSRNGSKQRYFVRRYGEPVSGNDGL